MNFLTVFAMKQPRLLCVLLLAIIVLGTLIFLNYPRREDPTISIRTALVTARFPGMSVKRAESLLAKPIEEKIREIPEVDKIETEAKTGSVLITVSLYESVYDLDPVWRKLRDKMNDLKEDLPTGTQGPFVNDDYGLTAIATIALTSDGFSFREMRDTARDIRDSIYTLDGVKKVQIYGEQPQKITVKVSNARLAESGLTPDSIAAVLQKQNIILPGGVVDTGGLNLTLEPSGNYEHIDDIGKTLILLPGPRLMPLKDIAQIEEGYKDPPDKLVYFNGEPALVISVSIKDSVNSVAFGKTLTQHLENLEAGLPLGLNLAYATYQPDIVHESVSNAVNNVYQTLAIVFLVVMLFLGMRTGLIVGLLVPLSILSALIGMSLLNIEFQRMSIAALIIALGLLVDNGIVMAEDIRRRLEQGDDRQKACLEAGKSLALPLLTASLTTILAFMPMMLSVGTAGEYTRALSQVLTIVLLSSWLLSMTAMPVLCFWFMKVKTQSGDDTRLQHANPYDKGAYKAYTQFLSHVLAKPFLSLAVVILFFLGALGVFTTVPKVFFPSSERAQLLVYLDLPAGVSITETDRIVKGISQWMTDKNVNPDFVSNIAYVADGGPRFVLALNPINPDPQHAFIALTLTSVKTLDKAARRLHDYILNTYPEARGTVKKVALGPGEAGLIEVRLSGPDADILYDKARELETLLHAEPGAINIEDDWENRIVKILVKIDQIKARRVGVTSEDIARALNSYLSGGRITDYRDGDVIIPIEWRGRDAERNNLESIWNISVYSSLNETSVPLDQIATIEGDPRFGIVKRRNQVRTITVSAKHQTMPATEFSKQVEKMISKLNLPPSYSWAWGGEPESSSDAQKYLFEKLPFCFIAIVILLIWQFNSFRRPLIILLTIPLSFIGAFLGLKIMGANFGFMSILGMLALSGIIINNGIVMIERIDEERSKGAHVKNAVIRAAATRLRPIVMTTVTTALGLIPLILFGGSLWYGLANVIAWGLVVGTALTLLIVPVFYTLFFPERREKNSA